MKINVKVLQFIYVGSFVLLAILVVLTPSLITGRISVFSEEMAEGAILLILLVLGYTINYFYQQELQEHKSELHESLRYIGALNIQVEKIRELNQSIRKYPTDKSSLKEAYQNLAECVLGVIDCDWIGFRVISRSQRTLSEYICDRSGESGVVPKPPISNKDLLERGSLRNLSVFSGLADNGFLVYCVIPKKNLNESQEILAQAVINSLAMLYTIYHLSGFKQPNQVTLSE